MLIQIIFKNRLFLNAQIAVPLKYLSNFFRSLEMRLINCKLHRELNWTKNSVMSNVSAATTLNCMFRFVPYQLKKV